MCMETGDERLFPSFSKEMLLSWIGENIFYASKERWSQTGSKVLVFIEKSSIRFSGVGKVSQLLELIADIMGN